jgi:hypothetical protein
MVVGVSPARKYFPDATFTSFLASQTEFGNQDAKRLPQSTGKMPVGPTAKMAVLQARDYTS